MTDRFLPYGRQWVQDEDIQAVVNVLRGDWLTTGPNVAHFEKALAQTTGADHAVAVNSGTAALHAAYSAVGLESKHEIITSPLTFAATANAARYIGATVRFADVDAETGLLDPAAVASLINERTRIIVPVDYTGQPADYDTMRSVIGDRPIPLVADGAHSLGATDNGRPVGTLADLTTLSFHPVKPITSGEGGAIVCSNQSWDSHMRAFRSHGITPADPSATNGEPWRQQMTLLGFNYRITDIQCALGQSQLSRLGQFIDRRSEIACKYFGGLANLDTISLPVLRENVTSGWHLFTIRSTRDTDHRRALFHELRSLGVGVQVHYEPVHHHPYYRDLGYDPASCPNAVAFASQVLSLPIFPAMTNDDIQWVIETVHRAVETVR